MPCPTTEILTDFALGEFDHHQAAEIAAHIDTCQSCETFVGGVILQTLELPVDESLLSAGEG